MLALQVYMGKIPKMYKRSYFILLTSFYYDIYLSFPSNIWSELFVRTSTIQETPGCCKKKGMTGAWVSVNH